MKKFVLGALVGAGATVIAGIVGLMLILPAGPPRGGSRLRVSESPVPDGAGAKCSPSAVGFDIYTNVRAVPEIRMDKLVPAAHTMVWSASSDQLGRFVVRGTIWLAVDGTLHEFASFREEHETSASRFVTSVTIVMVDEARHVRVRAVVAELDIDSTFGPWPLPGAAPVPETKSTSGP